MKSIKSTPSGNLKNIYNYCLYNFGNSNSHHGDPCSHTQVQILHSFKSFTEKTVFLTKFHMKL